MPKEANGQGFELDLEALFTDRLSVTLGASYNDTEIKDAGLAIQPCGGGCTVTDPAGASVEGTVSDRRQSACRTRRSGSAT
jgi:hypothetical protein